MDGHGVTPHVILLRGVNVGGHNRLPMADLRTLLASLGLGGVVTYLQSSNAVGMSTGTPAELAAAVADGLASHLGLSVPVIVRSGTEWAATEAANPLIGFDDDPTRLHVTFLDGPPEPDRVRTLAGEAAALAPERIEVVGSDAFLHTPGGFGSTAFTPAFLERRLGRVATTRNWRTVLALRDLVDGAG